MLKAKLFFFGALILFSGILIYSCTKDGVKNETQEEVTSEDDIETLKSILKIGDEDIATARTSTDCGTPNCSLYLSGVSETVLIPSLGCYAKVTYDIYRCIVAGNPTTITDVFKNFKAVPVESMGCTALLDAWTVLYNNGSYDVLGTELDLFNSLASVEVEKKWSNYFFTSQPFMKSFFKCGKANKYSIEFFMDNCYKWCVKRTIENGSAVWDFVRTNCSSNCCKRVTGYCWDQLTNSLVKTAPSYFQIGDCAEPQEVNCGEGYIKAGNCFHTCFPQ